MSLKELAQRAVRNGSRPDAEWATLVHANGDETLALVYPWPNVDPVGP